MSKLKEYKFNELYTMGSGISSKPEQAGHGSPFVSFSTVFNNYFLPDIVPDLMDTSEQEQEKYSIKKGDILLTRTSETVDELGMSCVVLKDYPKATFSGFVKRLRPMQKNITYDKYMGFYLRSKFFRKTMTNNAFITLRASLNEAIFSYINLYLPDYQTQKKIGDFLHLLNAKIELNQRINAELSFVAKTLYDYWFVQFDFPNEKGKPYKSAGGKMVWNEVLKREIPLGWEVKSLADITDVSTETLNPMNSPSKDFKHYSIPSFDEIGTYKIEKGEDIWSNKFSVQNTDVLVSKLNPWFSRVIYSTDDSDLICSTEFVVWRTTNVAIKNYMYMIARDSSFITYCTQSASGTSNSHKRVNPTVMMKYKIVYDKEIANKFGTILGSTIKMYAKNKVESQTLTELRDWLLPMLMNGQVRVSTP